MKKFIGLVIISAFVFSGCSISKKKKHDCDCMKDSKKEASSDSTK